MERLEGLMKGKVVGAVWEVMLVVVIKSKGVVVWETWEARLVWGGLEANKLDRCETFEVFNCTNPPLRVW